jgi:hypothetical protein
VSIDYLTYVFDTTSNSYSLPAMEWFANAFRKRVGVSTGTGGTVPGIPDATSNVQGCTSLTAISGADNCFPLSRIQYWIQHTGYQNFIVPASLSALPSTTRPDRWATWADLADQAGLNDGKGDGWRRKKQREITSTSATVDEDGNTIADDMVARLIVAPYGDYRRTSGAWVKLPSVTRNLADLPDILDSAVEDEGGGFYCAPEVSCRANDILGAWIQNEVRDVLKLLYVTRIATFGATGCGGDTYTLEFRLGSGDSGDAGADGTLATAKGYAEDGWDNVTRFGIYTDTHGPGAANEAIGLWSQSSTVDTFENYSVTAYHVDPSDGFDRFVAVLRGSQAFYVAQRKRALAGIDADVELVVKASDAITLSGGGITSTTFDNNGIGGTNGQYVVLQTKQITTTDDNGDDDWYFDVVGDPTTKPTWDVTSLSDGDIAQRGAHYDFETYFKWDFGEHGTYTLAGSDEAVPLEVDCPADRCWYLLEYSASCLREERPEFTVAEYTETQVDVDCDPAHDSALVPAGTNAEGFTKYQRWVPGDACPGGEGDCPDLDPRALTRAEARGMGLPEITCEVLDNKCVYTLESYWMCDLPEWNGVGSPGMTIVAKNCGGGSTDWAFDRYDAMLGAVVYSRQVVSDTDCTPGMEEDCPDVDPNTLSDDPDVSPPPEATTYCVG